jgi:hypothetical protein
VNHHHQVPFHLLKDVPGLSTGDPGSGNIIVQGAQSRRAQVTALHSAAPPSPTTALFLAARFLSYCPFRATLHNTPGA